VFNLYVCEQLVNARSPVLHVLGLSLGFEQDIPETLLCDLELYVSDGIGDDVDLDVRVEPKPDVGRHRRVGDADEVLTERDKLRQPPLNVGVFLCDSSCFLLAPFGC
jgi:hypothetical protein